jgi:phosphoserine phosphatase
VKAQVARRAALDPGALHYNQELLVLLARERALGRPLVLATGSDARDARAVATHVGIFDEVIASDGHLNITGHRKAAALLQRFRRHGYDYVGNSWADIPVWRHARHAWVVSNDESLVTAASRITSVEKVLRSSSRRPT